MHQRPEATVTHAFLDARLDAVETRMDARVDRMEQKMDAFEQRIDTRMNAFEQRMDQFTHSLQQMQQSLQDVRTEHRDAIDKLEKSIGSMKSHVLLTAISSVVAIVLGVAAFNSSIVGSVTTAFDSGRQSAAILARIEAQQQQHDQLLQAWVQQQRQRG